MHLNSNILQKYTAVFDIYLASSLIVRNLFYNIGLFCFSDRWLSFIGRICVSETSFQRVNFPAEFLELVIKVLSVILNEVVNYSVLDLGDCRVRVVFSG